MNTILKVLKAQHGDCIIIDTFDKNKNSFVILIDGGPPQSYKTSLRKVIEGYSKINLVILTHIDRDHIGGLLSFLNSDLTSKIEIEKIIVNSHNLIKVNSGTQISYQDGVSFEKKVFEKYPNSKIYEGIVGNNNFELPDGIFIDILSPTKSIVEELHKNWTQINLEKEGNTQVSSTILAKAKDYDIVLDELSKTKDNKKSIEYDIFNASSIAFSLRVFDADILFLGDAHCDVICDVLENRDSKLPIQFKYIKLSHHGSKFNISNRLLDCVQSENFIVSTNGGSGQSKHPDRQTIAKIVCHPKRTKKKINIYSNYPLEEIQKNTGILLRKTDEQHFNFQIVEKTIFL